MCLWFAKQLTAKGEKYVTFTSNAAKMNTVQFRGVKRDASQTFTINNQRNSSAQYFNINVSFVQNGICFFAVINFAENHMLLKTR